MAINISVAFVLTLAYVIALHPFSDVSHIILTDETASLKQGLTGNFSYANFESSPMYSHLYQFLGLFVDNAQSLYLLNHAVLFFSFLFLLALVLMVYTKKPVLVFIITGLFLYLPGYQIWPRVNFLTCIVLLLFLFAIYPIKQFSIKVALAIVVSYLLVFVRPEFFLSFYVFYFMGVTMLLHSAYLYYKDKPLFAGSTHLFASLAVVTTLMLFFVTPSVSDSDRSFEAFSQHYSFAIHLAEGLKTNPWHAHLIIRERDFPGADSVVSALMVNPEAFIQHVTKNVLIGFLFVLGVFGFIYLYMAVANKKLLPEQWNVESIFLLVFMLPIAIGVALVYPREHYLLVMFVLLALLPSLLFSKRHLSLKRVGISLSIVLLITVMLPPKKVFLDKGIENQLAVIGDVEREFTLGRVLGAEDGWCIYLDTCHSNVKAENDATADWIKDNIDTIFITNGLLKSTEDKEIELIIQQPELYGFTEKKINADLSLLLKNDKS
ncbi:MAG: hypothetical protein OXE99_13470 [Cellvibrionales bacterium]|nr:hypothetical protein [Cellvibrionales bacterium]